MTQCGNWPRDEGRLSAFAEEVREVEVSFGQFPKTENTIISSDVDQYFSNRCWEWSQESREFVSNVEGLVSMETVSKSIN